MEPGIATGVLEERSLSPRRVLQSVGVTSRALTVLELVKRSSRSAVVATRANWNLPAEHLATLPIRLRLQSHCQGPRYNSPLAGKAPSLQAGRMEPSIVGFFFPRS